MCLLDYTPAPSVKAVRFRGRQHGLRSTFRRLFRMGCRTHKLPRGNARTTLLCLLGRSARAFPKSLAGLPKSLAVFRQHRHTFTDSRGVTTSVGLFAAISFPRGLGRLRQWSSAIAGAGECRAAGIHTTALRRSTPVVLVSVNDGEPSMTITDISTASASISSMPTGCLASSSVFTPPPTMKGIWLTGRTSCSRISVQRKNETRSILYSRTAGGRMDNWR
jgi:hypothetical protein